MALVVRAFPVTCDRVEVEQFAAEMRQRSGEARRFYTGFGVRREAWFYQDAPPYGALVIGVTDIAEVQPAAEGFAASQDDFATWFKDRVLKLSGVDENEQPLGPETEMVFDSSGAELPPGIALSARIYPARSREAVMEFVGELRSRQKETSAFYENYEVPREVWFLQGTDNGPVVIGVTAMTSPKRAFEYAESKESFASWFKQRVVDVTGVDPNVTPLGPPSDQVFDFRA